MITASAHGPTLEAMPLPGVPSVTTSIHCVILCGPSLSKRCRTSKQKLGYQCRSLCGWSTAWRSSGIADLISFQCVAPDEDAARRAGSPNGTARTRGKVPSSLILSLKSTPSSCRGTHSVKVRMRKGALELTEESLPLKRSPLFSRGVGTVTSHLMN